MADEATQGRQRELLTFGHGRLSAEELGDLVAGAGVELVVDIRRFPGSRTNEAAAKGQVPQLLDQRGIDYRWDERLGGRRSLSAEQDADSLDPWWQVKAFRAYAAWSRSAEFRAGVDDLLRDVGSRRTAVMCSESVWWRCHRRIVADVALVEHGIRVEHLMHDGPPARARGERGCAAGLPRLAGLGHAGLTSGVAAQDRRAAVLDAALLSRR